MQELNKLREKIDEIDSDLIKLLGTRAQVSKEILKIKQKKKLTVLDPVREKKVIQHCITLAKKEGIEEEVILPVIQQILNLSKSIQKPKITVVAIQGKQGSFSALLASKLFIKTKLLEEEQFEEVVEYVEKNIAEFGILPVENSTTGRIQGNIELLVNANIAITQEVVLPVNHCLIAKGKLSLNQIKQVYAHPQALFQCKNFLKKLKNAEIIAFNDGAAAVKKLEKKGTALIASKDIVRHHKVAIVQESIQDSAVNQTKFFVVQNSKNMSLIGTKTTILFTVSHKTGALMRVLNVFAQHKINLMKLESIPLTGMPWEYLFWVDLEGDLTNKNIANGIKLAKQNCGILKILGSYKTLKLENEV
ncbi:MAG: prephenate dehydratase domain-containing protein [Candidatus Diapherotrites archaeon]|nr:prephenate dehydratase domain-containing protein [Candidatus Diapherotrites archaeon]